jgi:NADH:ubiquinone oxidoreductase subunit
MLRACDSVSTRCWGQGGLFRRQATLDAKPGGAYSRPVLKSIFTWWNGATIGIRFNIGRRAVFIGEDDTGNRYYESKDNRDSYDARKRRWVIYNGYAEASKVPPDWHGWLHYTFDEPPTIEPLKRRVWEKDHLPNLTGTLEAWRPVGSISRTGERPHATGDYQAWTPD